MTEIILSNQTFFAWISSLIIGDENDYMKFMPKSVELRGQSTCNTYKIWYHKQYK